MSKIIIQKGDLAASSFSNDDTNASGGIKVRVDPASDVGQALAGLTVADASDTQAGIVNLTNGQVLGAGDKVVGGHRIGTNMTGAKYIGGDTSNIGVESISVFGTASGVQALAVGGTASGVVSTALGFGAQASGSRSTAAGFQATASHNRSIALGDFAATTKDNQVVLGNAIVQETVIRGAIEVGSGFGDTGSVGTAGQVLTSSGPGAPAVWAVAVPDASATVAGRVNLVVDQVLGAGRKIVDQISGRFLAAPSTALDTRVAEVFSRTISGATSFTFTNPNSAGVVTTFVLELTNGGTNVTWPASVKWEGGTAPTLTATGLDILGFYTRDGGTTWRGIVLSLDNK
jgi:hypothetical protein